MTPGRGLILVVGAVLGAVALWPAAVGLLDALAPDALPDDIAPPGQLPAFLLDAPEETREVYRWAAANSALLRFIPCYCGCAGMGHDSNAACYLRGVRPNGATWYERHGARCGGCLAVTRDVMALHGSGASAREIRKFVDATHGGDGHPTPTLWPSQ